MKTSWILVITALLTGPVAAADDGLYRALGAAPGLSAVTADFVDRLKADPAIGHFFKDVNRKHLVQQLGDQFCQVAGGPCVYEGETMKNSHADMGVQPAHFNRLVEVLQDSLDAHGVPFPAQRELLARLAPLHRDIVEPP